ncbi:hypothetical protein BX666DRAFT_67029 [Dichotomocladium elegans]|nr:hypothetical protein BX666DRAFT_67029 [Dichotomocladium elegans]
MMMMPPPAPPPAFPAPFPQMGFLGAQKIHINPKFAASRPDIFGANDNNSKRTANQQQQQRLQPAMQNTPHSLQENSDSNALKRQRELIMEQQRKRRERREAEGKGAIMGGGVATDGSHPQHQGRTSPPISTVVHNGTHQQQPGTAEKRDITIKGLGTPKGISIKGAAAAAAAAAAATTTVANSPPLQQYQPPHRRRLAGASSAPSSSPSPRSDSLPSARMVNPVAGTPSVLSRVTPRGTKRPSSPPDVKKYEPAAKKAAIPIQTAGKSATITIANVSSNVSENDIMGLAKSIPGRIENVKLDKSAKKAIVAFDSPESAVIFRRQYNRSQFHGEVIIVTFCT